MPSVDDFCLMLEESKYFDELEVKILKAMLVLRQAKKIKNPAAEIAGQASMSVTNAYKYLYSLQQKGLVESNKDKNKIFWLSGSSNPFPRIFSYIGKDYLRKKEVFDRLEMVYEKMMKPGTSVWAGERLHEHYDTNFTDRAAFLMDVAREDIIITAYRLYSDFILLDALKRAVARGVKIRIIAEEIDASVSEKLRKIGVEMRLGRAWPYVVIADANHGITVDSDGKGLWFLNYNTDYRRRFDEMWDKAEEV